MVFIYGVLKVCGSKDVPAYDGTAFAKSGVVFVSINYRLGVEGFLPIDDQATNLGLREQISALEWVQDNIAAFGGDPGNITVFGESARASSIAVLLAAPAARGLFHRAILQSGNAEMRVPLAAGRGFALALSRIARVTPDLVGFRDLSPWAWLDAVEAVQAGQGDIGIRDRDGRDPAYGMTKFMPVYGDDVLPLAPAEALARGAAIEIDVLIGTDVDEMALVYEPSGFAASLEPADAAALLIGLDPGAEEAVAAQRLVSAGADAGKFFERAVTDLMWRAPAMRLAATRRGRTHLYVLTGAQQFSMDV